MDPMAAVMRYRKVLAQVDAANRFSDTVKEALSCVALGGKARVVTAVAKAVLLRSPLVVKGKPIDVVARSVGCGVWELSRAEVTPEGGAK